MIDINGIKKILPHRYPFLLIDKIIDFDPGISAHAQKCVTINEPFFEGHFPDRPLMPGVLIIEAIVQAACFTVIPGDVLDLKVNKINKVKNVYKFEGKCLVNDAIHAQCIFSAMIHDIPSTPK